MTKGNIIGALVLVLFLAAVFVYAGAVQDQTKMCNESIEARIELLEKQIESKIRPIIQINRATVYNTDGEIAIETIEETRHGF